ncbi:hypothetical protein ACQPZX_38625 [Actinoplanes sp. CA-142083]|uniref:hypothetical protein n=1 Tax=Actinoplanes sp. CA-142083 TaxID=3239903 RepID=UPI003D8D4AE3
MTMAANTTPADLAHRVRVGARSCTLTAQRWMLKRTFHHALAVERRAFMLGINTGHRLVICSRPECGHGDEVPSVIPWVDAIELELNGWKRPPRSVDLPLLVELDRPSLRDGAWGIAVGWHPAVWLPEWWMEESGE